MTKDFLKAVIQGEKQLLKKKEVQHVDIPHYEELSVKNIYPMMKDNQNFQQYFPDKYSKGKAPNRDYFFNIMATLEPDYLWQLVEHANQQRMTGEGEMMKSQAIKMSEYWAEQLKAMPYLSSKYNLLSIAQMTSLNRKTWKDP